MKPRLVKLLAYVEGIVIGFILGLIVAYTLL
jgi:hypothetical protein